MLVVLATRELGGTGFTTVVGTTGGATGLGVSTVTGFVTLTTGVVGFTAGYVAGPSGLVPAGAFGLGVVFLTGPATPLAPPLSRWPAGLASVLGAGTLKLPLAKPRKRPLPLDTACHQVWTNYHSKA